MSMKNEIHRLRGQLAEHEQLLKNYDMEVSGLIILIRELIDPYEEDVTRLRTGEALQNLKRLDKCVEKMKELQVKIDTIKADLDG
jgi:hypothetical protein